MNVSLPLGHSGQFCDKPDNVLDGVCLNISTVHYYINCYCYRQFKNMAEMSPIFVKIQNS